VIGSAVWLLSVAAIWSHGRYVAHRADETDGWVQATGVVTASDWGTETDPYSGSTSALVASVDYDYEVGGRRLSGSRYWSSVWDRSAVRAMADRLPAGATVRVYVDPDAPTHSVLHRGDSPQGRYFGVERALFGLLVLPATFLPLLAVGLAVAAIRKRRNAGTPGATGRDGAG
jgi:hypothetical protein